MEIDDACGFDDLSFVFNKLNTGYVIWSLESFALQLSFMTCQLSKITTKKPPVDSQNDLFYVSSCHEP